MEDLLNEQEIHLLGLQALVPWLESRHYKIDYLQPDKYAVPHIFALSGSILTVIVVAVDMYPHKGVVTDIAKAAALKVAGEMNALCAIASIGLVNIDGVAAADKNILGKPARNGHFKADFGGLQYIHFEN